MSNPTQVPVRRVRTISAYSGAASVVEARPVDAESAEEYEAYEGYESYDGQDAHEEYDQYDEPQRTGLFSSPARALALGGSVLALLLVFAVAIFIANGRGPKVIGEPLPRVTDVPVISNISQNGALSTGSVPPNFEWTDSQGNTVSLASLKGKSVWINFWGTWCPPCRAEMPAMEKVYTKHKDDLVILGVSMAPRDDPGVVSDFLKQNRYSWTFIHDGDQELAMRYQAGSIPMSYFIGPDGTVRAASMGAIPENMMENFIAQAKQ